MMLFLGAFCGIILSILLSGFYVVQQDERAVKTVFGKAQQILTAERYAGEGQLSAEELERYNFPNVRVIQPGGPYFKMPWEKVHKVSVATQTLNMAHDPESSSANKNNTVLDAITKDQLNIDLTGQIRYRVSEQNLYAYLFGIKKPICHIVGYFVSVLRERVANFGVDKKEQESEDGVHGAGNVSLNDLRKNLPILNNSMDAECVKSVARYGIEMQASLVTEIVSPGEIESALAAIIRRVRQLLNSHKIA